MELCQPILVYLGINVATSIGLASLNPPVGLFLINVLVLCVWGCLLQFFCMIHLTFVSWILLPLPLILMLILYILYLIFFAPRKIDTDQ